MNGICARLSMAEPLSGVNAEVVRLIYSESICQMAQQLLGQLRQAVVGGLHGKPWVSMARWADDPALGNEGARGPARRLCKQARGADGCHTDGRVSVGGGGLLDDCPADGVLKVWPGSIPPFLCALPTSRRVLHPHLPAFKGIAARRTAN